MPGPASAIVANCRFTAGSSGGSRGASGAAPGSSAKLGAMASDRRQLQRRKDEIELAHRPAAHEGDGAAGAFPKPRQRVAQRVRNEDLARGGSEIEQRSVDIEQDGNLVRSAGSDGMRFDITVVRQVVQIDARHGRSAPVGGRVTRLRATPTIG